MPADLVVTDARIYTAGPQRGMAEALAVKNGLIVFVGKAVDANAWIGPHTQTLRFVGRESEAGSLEAGKSADFIVVDRDILKLADEDRADEIRDTHVLETWFMGRRVYAKRGQTK